jgi:hypothetical protein
VPFAVHRAARKHDAAIVCCLCVAAVYNEAGSTSTALTRSVGPQGYHRDARDIIGIPRQGPPNALPSLIYFAVPPVTHPICTVSVTAFPLLQGARCLRKRPNAPRPHQNTKPSPSEKTKTPPPGEMVRVPYHCDLARVMMQVATHLNCTVTAFPLTMAATHAGRPGIAPQSHNSGAPSMSIPNVATSLSP